MSGKFKKPCFLEILHSRHFIIKNNNFSFVFEIKKMGPKMLQVAEKSTNNEGKKILKGN